MAEISPETKTVVDVLASVGVQGAACLTESQVNAMGNLTLNELKCLAKSQQALGVSPAGGGMCGGYIF